MTTTIPVHRRLKRLAVAVAVTLATFGLSAASCDPVPAPPGVSIPGVEYDGVVEVPGGGTAPEPGLGEPAPCWPGPGVIQQPGTIECQPGETVPVETVPAPGPDACGVELGIPGCPLGVVEEGPAPGT